MLKVVNFEEIVEPIIDILHNTHDIKLKKDRKFDYEGLDRQMDKGTTLSAKEVFSEKGVEFAEENYGEYLKLVIAFAIKLGIEQGIAIEKHKKEVK